MGGKGSKKDKTPQTTESHIESTWKDYRLEEVLKDLENSKTSKHSSVKGFFQRKDSAEYSAVKDNLRLIISSMKVGFNEDFRSNMDKLKRVEESYLALIEACQKYIAKSGGESETGKARKQKVKQILLMAEADCDSVQRYYNDIRGQRISEEEQEKLTWQKIIYDGRADVIEVDDITSFKALGNAGKTGENVGRMLDEGVFQKKRYMMIFQKRILWQILLLKNEKERILLRSK